MIVLATCFLALSLQSEPPLSSMLGHAVASLGDIDGQGVADLLVSCPYDQAEVLGGIYALRGEDGALLYSVPDEGVGRLALAIVGDVDGDGAFDFVTAGTPGDGRPHVRLFSGRDGHQVDEELAGERSPQRINALPYPTELGASYLLLERLWDDPGYEGRFQIRSFRSETGAVDPPRTTIDFDPESAALVRDVDGRGRADFAAGISGRVGRVVVIASEDGSVLRSILGPEDLEGVGFGHRIADVGDLNGDGHSDLVVTTDDRFLVSSFAAAVCVESGEVLWTFEAGPRMQIFGESVVGLPDIDGDSVPDVGIGSLGWKVFSHRGAYIVSGKDGRLIRRIESECEAGSSMALLSRASGPPSIALGGCYWGDNPYPETSGFIGVFELDGTPSWALSGDDLRAR